MGIEMQIFLVALWCDESYEARDTHQPNGCDPNQ
jgi:hypothetical protein